MLESPDIAADRIVAAVQMRYGIGLTALTFLPLGHDARAFAYRAEAADAAYFLKLRQGRVSDASVQVPRYLVDHGATHVVAPLPACDGRLTIDLDAYWLTLYPFIDGRTGLAQGLDERQWLAYGAALRELHTASLAPEIAGVVPREQFTIAHLFARQRQTPWPEVVAALRALGTRSGVAEGSARELAAFWQRRRAEIELLTARLTALGEMLRAAPPPLVLCHADVHPNNILLGTDGGLWIVDWDEVLFAPKEADLMMGVGGLGNYPAGPREAASFLRGYGSTAIDAVALAYYRHVRAVSDIGADAEQVLLLPASEATKRGAVAALESLFAPGQIVDLARQADRLAR